MILKIDADEVVAESNEGNNIISAPFSVNGGGPTTLCSFTTYYTPPGLDPLDIIYGRDFDFVDDANGYTISQKKDFTHITHKKLIIDS